MHGIQVVQSSEMAVKRFELPISREEWQSTREPIILVALLTLSKGRWISVPIYVDLLAIDDTSQAPTAPCTTEDDTVGKSDTECCIENQSFQDAGNCASSHRMSIAQDLARLRLKSRVRSIFQVARRTSQGKEKMSNAPSKLNLEVQDVDGIKGNASLVRVKSWESGAYACCTA